MKKLFYSLITIILLTSCNNVSKKSLGSPQAIDKQYNHIEVLYFHGAQRCITCRAIERKYYIPFRQPLFKRKSK